MNGNMVQPPPAVYTAVRCDLIPTVVTAKNGTCFGHQENVDDDASAKLIGKAGHSWLNLMGNKN